MMHHVALRRIVLALLLLTFVGGGWPLVAVQAAPQPCTMAMTGSSMPDTAMPAGHPDKPIPCEDAIPACAKQFCYPAGVILAVPQPFPLPQIRGAMQYLPETSPHGGRIVEPELFPPIAA
jgi:hypothetical protein